MEKNQLDWLQYKMWYWTSSQISSVSIETYSSSVTNGKMLALKKTETKTKVQIKNWLPQRNKFDIYVDDIIFVDNGIFLILTICHQNRKLNWSKLNGKLHRTGHHVQRVVWLMVLNHSKVALLIVFTMTSKSVNDIVPMVISHLIGRLARPMKFHHVNPNGPYLIGDHVQSHAVVV